MKDFKHRHIMPLIGVCLDSGVGVVMPYMANGSVLNYLKEKRSHCCSVMRQRMTR